MDDLKAYISQKITKLRLAKGISARKLSQELDLGDNYINQVENLQCQPSLVVIDKICKYFEIAPGDLFDTKTQYPIQYQELIKELNKLDSQEIEKVIEFVKLITINKK